MEALKRSIIPDINNRPNEYLESITLRNDNGYQMINNRAARIKATKKRESPASPAKTSMKVTPTQKGKKLKRSPAKDSSSSSSSSEDDEDEDNDTDKEPGNNTDDNDNDDNDNDNDNDDNNNNNNSDNVNDNDNGNDKDNNLGFMNQDLYDPEDNHIVGV
jgi:hypothetical protein